jgi:hypothetical protein
LRDISELVNRQLPLEQKACLSKARFVSQREARRLARHGQHQDGSVEPYRCAWCSSWHLGHRRRGHH